MANLNSPIKHSSKNLFAVKAAVQSVYPQHPQAVQIMGGVNTLASVILGVISVGSITVGQAAAKVESALLKMFPLILQMLNSLAGLGGARETLEKILKKLA